MNAEVAMQTILAAMRYSLMDGHVEIRGVGALHLNYRHQIKSQLLQRSE
jgi:nucleoid DNA-binding protein